MLLSCSIHIFIGTWKFRTLQLLFLLYFLASVQSLWSTHLFSGSYRKNLSLFGELRLRIQGTKNAYTTVRPNDVILYKLNTPPSSSFEDSKKMKALGVFDGVSIVPLYARVEGSAEFYLDATSHCSKISSDLLQKADRLLRVVSSDRRGEDCFIIDEYISDDVYIPIREPSTSPPLSEPIAPSILSSHGNIPSDSESESSAVNIVEAQLEVARLKLKLMELRAKSSDKASRLESVKCPDAPLAIGPYSQAVKANGFLFLSGCLGFIPELMELAHGGIEDETRHALNNMKKIIEFGGGSLTKVVRTTIYLSDMHDFDVVNSIYAEYFKGEVLPARVTVAVKSLPKNAKIEIDAIVAL